MGWLRKRRVVVTDPTEDRRFRPRYILHAMKGVFLGTEGFAIVTTVFVAKTDVVATAKGLAGTGPFPSLDPFVVALFLLAVATVPATVLALRRAPEKWRTIMPSP